MALGEPVIDVKDVALRRRRHHRHHRHARLHARLDDAVAAGVHRSLAHRARHRARLAGRARAGRGGGAGGVAQRQDGLRRRRGSGVQRARHHALHRCRRRAPAPSTRWPPISAPALRPASGIDLTARRQRHARRQRRRSRRRPAGRRRLVGAGAGRLVELHRIEPMSNPTLDSDPSNPKLPPEPPQRAATPPALRAGRALLDHQLAPHALPARARHLARRAVGARAGAVRAGAARSKWASSYRADGACARAARWSGCAARRRPESGPRMGARFLEFIEGEDSLPRAPRPRVGGMPSLSAGRARSHGDACERLLFHREIRKSRGRRRTGEPDTPEFSGEMQPKNSDVNSSRRMRITDGALLLLCRRHDVGIFAQRKFWRHRSLPPPTS